jgi:hypothetical protein
MSGRRTAPSDGTMGQMPGARWRKPDATPSGFFAVALQKILQRLPPLTIPDGRPILAQRVRRTPFRQAEPLEDAVHQVSKATAIAAAGLRRLVRSPEPANSQTHDEIPMPFVFRSPAPVATRPGTTYFVHDYRLQSETRTFAVTTAAPLDNAPTFRAQHARRGDQHFPIGAGCPLLKLGDWRLPWKQACDHDRRAPVHIFDGLFRQYPYPSPDQTERRVVFVAQFPELSESIMRVSENALRSRSEEMSNGRLDADNEPVEPVWRQR